METTIIKIVVYLITGVLIRDTSVLALECYTCDSAKDLECATNPGQQISVEECSHSNDECVVVIVSGITRRGCLSGLFPSLYCPEPCDRCSFNLCNRHIFPTNRLQCYQCVGAECVDVRSKAKSNMLLPCPIYNKDDRCYTNVIGISNVQRGCEKTNLPSTCPNVCLKCNYDGCNKELGVHEESCFQCSHMQASPNPECLRNQAPSSFGAACSIKNVNHCTNKLLHGHRGKCFSYINEQTGVVQRGCSSTMGFYSTGTVTECYGDNCNDSCFEIACNNCTTSADGVKCRNGNIVKQVKCAANAFSCFTCEKGTQMRRGCIDRHFQPQSEEVCYQCRDLNNCNRTPARSCYQCSSLNDINCASWINSTNIPKVNCSHTNETCVTTLVNKFNLVYTVRGCAFQVPECTENDPYCLRCNGSLCNTVSLSSKSKSSEESQQKALSLLGDLENK